MTRTRKKPDRTGQHERRRSHSGRTRLPDVRALYRHQREPIEAGNFEYGFTLLGRTHAVPLGKLVEGASWADESATLTGSLVVRRPDPEVPSSLIIAKGDRVRCSVQWRGRFRRLWTMRVQDPSTDPVNGTVSFDLIDDLIMLTRNRRDWMLRKTKRRKRGYYLHEVVEEVGRREGVKLGRVARGTKRFELKKKNASALDVLRAACQKEQDASGVRFVIRMVDDHLDVLPYGRNPLLYQLGEGKVEGVTLEQTSADRPVTVIEARGHIGKGKKATKVRATVFDRSHVRRFGRVVEERHYGKVASRADLMSHARRDLAKAVRVKRTGTLSHRAIPFIRRGDGIRWPNNEPGWYGKAQHSRDRTFSYVTSASFALSGADQTMDLSVTQEDPFFKDQERLDKERRRKAREARKKRRARGAHG